ncbi:MAG: hypothetical protein IJS99_00545 [Synergistaceae bacterium]|nr:hypothetical protein [Synergistaceae bacterium]
MRKIFASIVIVLCLSKFAFCAQREINHDWVWNVLVIPPLTGWESEPGKSINTALKWCEAEISDSGTGVAGHDLKFIRLTLNTSSDNPARDLNLQVNDHTAAIMSFSLSPEIDRVLVSRLAGREIPLMLAGGENVLIDFAGRPFPNIFALDLFRDYRCNAFTEYAKRIYKPDKRIALAASRFTVNQEREAKICYNMLDNAGFMPMPYWADASVRDSFGMMAEEIESYEGEQAGVIISFMGSMGAREIWRNFMRLRSNWRLWNCAEPDSSYLSCRGMIFADQNISLASAGGFIETKRELWRTRAMQVNDSVAAGRVVALTEWLKKAIELIPKPVDNLNYSLLLRNLERVDSIPFGNQNLNISSRLHRPSERNVFIVEVRNRHYDNLDIVNIRGLAYVPGY